MMLGQESKLIENRESNMTYYEELQEKGATPEEIRDITLETNYEGLLLC